MSSEFALSVIIPCHDVEPYLVETLCGLAANAADDVELIFVDDASTDRTGDLLARGTVALPNARVITNVENLGLARTRNVGLDAARGAHLAFLDADDVVLPGHYRRLLEVITRLGTDFVRTDHVQVTGRRRTVHRIAFGPRGEVADPREGILPCRRPTSVDYPYAWAGIYHRRLLERGLLHFSPELRTCEDRGWNWRLHLQAESFAVVGLLGVYYRRAVPTSLTQLLGPTQFDFLPAFRQILADVVADREAERFLPKALLSLAAIMCHHLGRRDGYGPVHHAELQRRCRVALEDLPVDQLSHLLDLANPDRRVVLQDVLTTDLPVTA